MKRSLAIAEAKNPNVLAAAYKEQASHYSVDVEKGNLLPQFNIQANYGICHKPSTQVRSQESGSLVGVLRIPLYQGGGVYSRIREAKHTNNQRRMEILDARRIVRQNVITSWNNIRAADEILVAARQRVKASDLAYSGVKQENLVGSRTTLDVLNAESELLNSKVSVVLAQREQVVSRYQLLASVGKLTSAFLNLGVSRYDPLVNYQRVKDKMFGADINESD
ncbi:MAG: TolC family protein [Hyphomicrobiales bacterium]